MDNRTNLMTISLRLFARHGFDAVGVQQIVDEAGITKPTLYHFFGSKQGLLKAVLEDYFPRLNQDLRLAAAYQHDLPDSLTRVMAACFAFARQNPTFYRLQLGLWFAPPDSEAHQLVQPWQMEQYEIIETLFRLAAHDHGNMKGRHGAYAATFQGAIHTYIGMALNGYIELNDELVWRAARQFQHGIYS